MPTKQPDPDPLDSGTPIVPIAISPGQLRDAMRFKWLNVAAVAAITALSVGALLWWATSGIVVRTVRNDVKRAAIFNCNRTNHYASTGEAVRQFLDSDATLNRQLGVFDEQTATANRQLSHEVGLLGDQLPAGISRAFTKLQSLYQKIATLRLKAATLWSGPPTRKRHTKSLSAQVLLVSQVPCDKIISP